MKTGRLGAASESSPSPQTAEPKVFDFRDYREFLKTWLEWKKSKLPAFSGAMFAQKGGFSSHTLLGMVIRGQRNLGYETIQQFARALGLNRKEQTYFERLVLFNQATRAEDRTRLFSELARASQGEHGVVLRTLDASADMVRGWYVLPVLELADLPDFQADADWIVRKLRRRISKKEAQETLGTLIAHGLIHQQQDGSWRRTTEKVRIDPDHVDFAIRKCHSDFLKELSDAALCAPKDEIKLSMMVVAASPEEVEAIRERVTEFRKQLNADFGRDPSRSTQVVAVGLQVLTVTGDPYEKREEKKP